MGASDGLLDTRCTTNTRHWQLRPINPPPQPLHPQAPPRHTPHLQHAAAVVCQLGHARHGAAGVEEVEAGALVPHQVQQLAVAGGGHDEAVGKQGGSRRGEEEGKK
jgi:hypothetical protein